VTGRRAIGLAGPAQTDRAVAIGPVARAPMAAVRRVTEATGPVGALGVSGPSGPRDRNCPPSPSPSAYGPAGSM
jgi:hypothetical protein